MNPSQFNPQQQAAMYQRQLAQNQMAQQQDPALQAQMRQAYLQQQQQQQQRMAMAQQGQFQQQGQQHLQPQFQQQRRPSPMGQMPQGQGHMGHPGQQNPMGGFGGMPPPSSGPMGVTMQPGMLPQQQQQQQAFQQQMMRNNNAQFPAGMNPQMTSVSPHPQGTPTRPPSQMQGTPGNMPGGGTPSNMMPGNGMTPGHAPQNTPQVTTNIEQVSQPQNSPMGPPGQNGSPAVVPTSQKVDLLLEINNMLLKLALGLQQQGKAFVQDQTSPTAGPGGESENGTQSPAQPSRRITPDMMTITRPLQANIAYLTGSQHQKRPKWPLFMDMPAAWPAGSSLPDETLKQLRELYARLRAAWPDYNPLIDPMTGLPKPTGGQMRPPQQQPQHQARPSMDNQGSPLAAG